MMIDISTKIEHIIVLKRILRSIYSKYLQFINQTYTAYRHICRTFAPTIFIYARY